MVLFHFDKLSTGESLRQQWLPRVEVLEAWLTQVDVINIT